MAKGGRGDAPEGAGTASHTSHLAQVRSNVAPLIISTRRQMHWALLLRNHVLKIVGGQKFHPHLVSQGLGIPAGVSSLRFQFTVTLRRAIRR
jgi:hypothetical protein